MPLIGLAFLLRLAAADQLPPHVDEGNMLLGIQTVADRGWPMLPSGVLYIHGATVSYLLAPLAKLGLIDYLHLLPMRLPSALFGAIAVWLTYRLGWDLLGRSSPALLAAALVALDPLNVLWGGFIRMYALLQVLALVVVLVYLRALARLDDAPDRPRGRAAPWLVALVVTFWLAVFTQVVAALLWPALALVAIGSYGRSLLGRRWGLTAALGLSAMAPLAFVAASTLIGYGSTTTRVTQGDAIPAGGFLGDDALANSNFLHPALRGLTGLYEAGLFAGLMPIILAGATGIVLSRYVLVAPAPDRIDRRGLLLLVLLFWIPIGLFAFFVEEQKSRYLLDVLPFGYLLIAAALLALVSYVTPRSATLAVTWAGRLVAALLVLLLLTRDATGLWTLPQWGIEQTQVGYGPALAYVAAHRAPTDWIVVGSTPEAALVLGNNGRELAYGGVLARPGSGKGTDTTKIDDWLGWQVLDTMPALCTFLTDHPGSWFVAGKQRLDGGKPRSEFASLRRNQTLQPDKPQTAVLLGATEQQFTTADGYAVLRTIPPDRWDQQAIQICTTGRKSES